MSESVQKSSRFLFSVETYALIGHDAVGGRIDYDNGSSWTGGHSFYKDKTR